MIKIKFATITVHIDRYYSVNYPNKKNITLFSFRMDIDKQNPLSYRKKEKIKFSSVPMHRDRFL